MTTRRARRLRRHTGLAVLAVAAGSGLALALPGDTQSRISLATAYLALAFFATTLVIGPLNVLSGKPNPVSFDLRRDLGIWSAILALAHTAFGLTVHFRGRMHLYFLAPPGKTSILGIRMDPFGLTNHAGLVTALVLALLAVLSSDRALASLGSRRWKAVQRTAYIAAALTLVHGLIYQVIEKRNAGFVAILAGVAAGVGVMQGLGYRARRRTPPPPAA